MITNLQILVYGLVFALYVLIFHNIQGISMMSKTKTLILVVKKNLFCWMGLGFGLFYWFLESIRDVVILRNGDLFTRLFYPDASSFWMRLLVFNLLILFGLYIEFLMKKDKEYKIIDKKLFGLPRIIFVGLSFCAIYWFLESIRIFILFGNESFITELFNPNLMVLCERILGFCIILLFGVHVKYMVRFKRDAEKTLSEKDDELKTQIRINRVQKVLIESNGILVEAKDETTLAHDICNLLIDVGFYRFAWVGLIDQNDLTHIKPISKAGKGKDYLDVVSFKFQKDEINDNPINRAIQTCKPFVFLNIQANPNCQLWQSEAIKRGFRSVVSFPLKNDNEVIGVINIYSEDENSFINDEINLLERLANDLAFGIGALRTRDTHKKLIKEKEKIEKQFLHIQKLEAVGILASGIAHDFNNLVTAILVFTDMAMEQVEKSDQIYQDLSDIKISGEKATKLIKQLLLFSKKQSQEYTIIDPNEIIQNLYTMLRCLIGEDVIVHNQLASDLWTILADRGTIEQVIMNLVVNARDAMPDGGELIIKTENIVLEEAQSDSIQESRPGRYVCVSISDTGIGISKNIMKNIFDPFFTTKGSREGTGLGLSVVYGIIKQHNGFIQVESRVGCGSTFRIYLPGITTKLEKKNENQLLYRKKELHGKGEKILLVEDESKVRDYLTLCLSQNGYVVFSASNAEEAMDIFQKKEADFHIIICDVVLPGKSGIELVDELLRYKSDLKVLFSSGYTDHKSRWLDIKEKGFSFIEKPYDSNTLLHYVKRITSSIAA